MFSFAKKNWYEFLTPISVATGLVYFLKLKEYLLGAFLTFMVPFLFLLPKKVLSWNKTTENPALASILKALASGIFILPFAGGLYLFRNVPPYDSFVHITISVFICFITAIFLSIGWPFRTPFSKAIFKKNAFNFKKLAVISLIITVVLGISWEVFEKVSDTYLGTWLFKDYFQPIAVDTIEDIIADFTGATFGAVYIYLRGPIWKEALIKEKELRN